MKKIFRFTLFTFLLEIILASNLIFGYVSRNELEKGLVPLFNDIVKNSPKTKIDKGAWESFLEKKGKEDKCPPGIKIEKNKVIELNLKGKDLEGKLPVSIKFLTNLTTLDLSNNQLTGEIPSWLENLRNLKILNLSGNQFDGKIPPWIGNLKSLEELRLDDNRLEGPIPQELGSLPNLRVLRISSNKLTGEIPTELEKLRELEDNNSDFRWNGLYTEEKSLKEFLQKKQKLRDWEHTQTVAPKEIRAVNYTEDTITIRWQPIAYTEEKGGYQVYYREPGQEKYGVVKVPGKKKTEVTVEALNKSTKYYFIIKSWTDKHDNNINRIESEPGKLPILAATRGIIISGKVERYLNTRKNDKQSFQGVRIQASNNGGETTTNKDGKYELNVSIGWSGTVKAISDGYTISPNEKTIKKYEDVTSDIECQDYTATSDMVISGEITYKEEPVPGVKIKFISEKGDNLLGEISTDETGRYVFTILDYGWTGRVIPEKAGHLFKKPEKYVYKKDPSPGEKGTYPAVTSRLENQDFKVSFPEISGEVKDRSKFGIPGVAISFSNIKLSYLKAQTVTGKDGNFRLDIPTDWEGSVTPKKKSYIFYPASSDLKEEDKNKNKDIKEVKFESERDFKVFVLIAGNYINPSEGSFDNAYGKGVFCPEITAGWKFSRNFYIWSGYGFFSKKGKTDSLSTDSRWKQEYISLGLGYYKNISIHFGWKARIGAVAMNYSEKWTWTDQGIDLHEEAAANAFGVRIEAAGLYKFSKQLFTEISVGYLYGKDTIENESVNLGGLRGGFRLGLRF